MPAPVISEHGEYVMALYAAGLRNVDIVKKLKTEREVTISKQALGQWIKRYLAKLSERAAVRVAPAGAVMAEIQPVQESTPPVQIPTQISPTQEKSTPSAVPAAGAPKAVHPANPAASLKPKLGRDDVDLSAVDALIAAGESLEGGSHSKPGLVLGKK